MDYRVSLDGFQGPLDLLLYLVKKNEVDVLDIPIATVTAQFIDYLNVLQVADVELAGDFLVMASHLMEIKSKLLLPHETRPQAEAEDPRRELVVQLVEYRKFKEAANKLEGLADERQRHLPRAPVAQPAGPEGPRPVRPVELWDLVSAFGRLISEAQAMQPRHVVADETPQHVYTQQVRDALAADGRVPFRDLFAPPFYRARLVGLFLAVLELIRRFEVLLEQDGLFGDIWLRAAPPAEESAPAPTPH